MAMTRCLAVLAVLGGVHLTAALAQDRDAASSGRQSATAERAAALAREWNVRVSEDGFANAIVDGRTENVTPERLASVLDQGAVVYKRINEGPEPVAVPEALQIDKPGVGERALQLGVMFNAKVLRPPQAAPSDPSTVPGAPAPGLPDESFVNLQALVSQGLGLLFDGSIGSYVGHFDIALANVANPADRAELSVPVPISVQAVGALEIRPRPVKITQLGRWQEVSIVVPNPQGERYPVSVSADPGDPGDRLELGIVRPEAQLSATQLHIAGWGIGQTPVSVRVRGMVSPQGYSVSLSTEGGGLSLGTVILDANGYGETSLRSDSADRARVRINNAELRAQPLVVTFQAPWLFLAAAVGGGLLGAFLRSEGRRFRGRAALIGAASGLLMTLAYAVGIDGVSSLLPQATLATAGEAVVFVLAALGALGGVRMLLPLRQQDEAVEGAAAEGGVSPG